MILPREDALVQTVEENMKSFTKRDVLQARKAKEMLARMGFRSVAQAISTAGSGSNCKVTARDFETADAIRGKDIASIKGKTKKQATPAADVNISPAAVQQDQVLSVDVMFIQKTAVLVGVSTPLDLTLATSLYSFHTLRLSRAAEAVKKVLLYFVGVLTSQNFKTRLIMTDGEGAVGKLRTKLNSLGIKVDVSGAGGHVARVERRIQVLKERVRTHYYYLPFVPSLLVLLFLVFFCASRLNYEPSSGREWMSSPREMFLGRKADARRDFQCAFGDYVQSTVPETDNSMKACTEDCVVMLPTGNRTGSVKMLSLRAGKITTRDQFKVLPMPLIVIERLNGMAAADGIHTASTTTGVFNDNVRDLDRTPSHLPTMFTPQTHTGDDPDIALQHPHGGLMQSELTDEVGLGSPDDTDATDVHAGYSEDGGVPSNFHDDVPGNLIDPTDANQQPYAEKCTSGATARETTRLGVILGVRRTTAEDTYRV
jgi:hypothetical protein